MRKNTTYREWLVAMLLPLLLSCQKDEIQTSGFTDERLIAFAPTIEGQWAETRASVLTAGNLQDFGVSASYYTSGSYAGAACGGYFYKQKVLTSARYCGREWAGEAYTHSFFGYAPYSNLIGIQSAEALGRPVYTYTVPSSIASQIDLMTAETLEVAGGNKTTPVPLAFSHRLSDIRFDIYNEGPQTMTVHSIALYGLKYSGTLNGDTWTPTGSANTSSVNPFKLDLADPADPDDGVAVTSGSTSAELTGTANHFMMIPQTVTSGTSIFFVDATVKGRRAVFHYTLDANLMLQSGKTYHVTLTMGYDDIRIKTLSVTDWTEDPASEGTTPPNQRISGSVGSNSQVDDWEENPSQEETTTANRRVGGNVGSGTGISDWTQESDESGQLYDRVRTDETIIGINTWNAPIMADYSIVNANTENKLINSTDGIATIYVDDVVQETPATTYKFTTTGYHRVKFELTEPTEIPESLFFGSSHLKNVTIPHQVETINTRAFYSCSELTEVHCLSLIPPALGTNVFDGGHAERKIYVAATVVDTYKNAPGWSQYASEIYPLQ